MKSRYRVTVILVLAALSIYLPGCPLLRRAPERAPLPPQRQQKPAEPRPQQPEIPAAIRRQPGEEPKLRVFFAENNQVKTMSIEEYLMGVVAAEMDPAWPREALAAQAIIARTFTLQKIAQKGGVPARNAHASTDIEEFQAYDAARINDNVREAVKATRGQAAVYGGDFIWAWFHAYAGPRTATAPEGLEFRGPNPPYIRIVDTPAEAVMPDEKINWEASFPLERVRNAVREVTGSDPGNITEIEVSKTGPSGRATRLRVNKTEVSAPQLRLALDSTVMRSTYLKSIAVRGNNVVISGSGYGHGVGMCQWGAHALAEKGRKASEIVRFYYPNVEIIRLWQ